MSALIPLNIYPHGSITNNINKQSESCFFFKNYFITSTSLTVNIIGCAFDLEDKNVTIYSFNFIL